MKSRRMRWVGHVVDIGKKCNTYRVWMEKPEGKRPPEELGTEGKLEHMITGLKELENEGVDWV